ncbi:unnamed protein product, partial [Polarella glacialis]
RRGIRRTDEIKASHFGCGWSTTRSSGRQSCSRDSGRRRWTFARRVTRRSVGRASASGVRSSTCHISRSRTVKLRMGSRHRPIACRLSMRRSAEAAAAAASPQSGQVEVEKETQRPFWSSRPFCHRLWQFLPARQMMLRWYVTSPLRSDQVEVVPNGVTSVRVGVEEVTCSRI